MVPPLRPAELILGKVAPFVHVGLFDVLVTLVVAVWMFEVPIRGARLSHCPERPRMLGSARDVRARGCFGGNRTGAGFPGPAGEAGRTDRGAEWGGGPWKMSEPWVFGGGILVAGILAFIFIRAGKRKPLTVISVIAEDRNNQGLFHVFGSVTYMPHDSPSYEIQRHYLLDAVKMKIVRGIEQRGAGFDLKSPFAGRCLEHMREVTGLDLAFGKPLKEQALRIVLHRRNESDTTAPEEIEGDALEVFDLSYRRIDRIGWRVRLGGRMHILPTVRASPDVFQTIWLRAERRLLVFYSRMGIFGCGVGLMVVDTGTGAILSNGYFKEN